MIAPPCPDENCKSQRMAITLVRGEPFKWTCSVCGKEVYVHKEDEVAHRLYQQAKSQDPLTMCRGGPP